MIGWIPSFELDIFWEMYCLLRYLLNVQFVLFSLLLVWPAMLAGSKNITYSRHWLLSVRSADLPALSKDVTTHIGLLGVRRHRGCRSGRAARDRRARQPPALQQTVNGAYLFISTRRTASSRRRHSNGSNSKNLTSVNVLRNRQVVVTSDDTVPSVYLLNAAGLTKPHAIEHLATDLTGNGIDVAIITQTHFKSKHSDGTFSIPGYTLYRRDRSGRRGGGVATYVRSTPQSTPWTPSADDKLYE